MAYCYFCGQELPYGERIYRTTMCEACGKPLKICRNCTFYAPGETYDCREHISDPVHDKERENLCDYFSPYEGPWKGNEKKKKQEEARKKFDSLFGDS